MKLDHKDKDRNTAEMINEMIGNKYIHVINRDIYTITGAVWNCDTDTWHILHIRRGSTVVFSRSASEFFGKHPNGQLRFVEV